MLLTFKLTGRTIRTTSIMPWDEVDSDSELQPMQPIMVNLSMDP